MSDLMYDYNNSYGEDKNTAMALFNIAEAIEKLADNIGQQKQDSQALIIKELADISNKMTRLYQIVETSIAKQDIEAIKDQLGEIQGTLLALNRLMQKKENP